MRYYTYKITFKDLPRYFYYGKHKDKGGPYYGTPKTWKHFWKQFEPEIQILQWYNTEMEVRTAEKAILLATWEDKYSLNENIGGLLSEEACVRGGKEGGKKSGKINGPENVWKMNDHANTVAVRSENGKKTAKAMNDHANTTANRSAIGKKTGATNGKEGAKKTGKRILLTNIATGEDFEFYSAREACRVLNLSQGNLCKVVAGKCKHHRGYTAEYI